MFGFLLGWTESADEKGYMEMLVQAGKLGIVEMFIGLFAGVFLAANLGVIVDAITYLVPGLAPVMSWFVSFASPWVVILMSPLLGFIAPLITGTSAYAIESAVSADWA